MAPLPLAARRCLLRLIDIAMAEDLASAGDVTSDAVVDAERTARGTLVAKQDLVVCGLQAAALVFSRYDDDLALECSASDGDAVQAGAALATVHGNARSLLAAERVALNVLQRLSGIATLTAAFVAATDGTDARIVDTRKTTAGWRALQKWAVRTGGGANHRMGLFDGVLIKDNHLVAAGGVRKAVELARAHVHHLLKIEVEVVDAEQLAAAVDAGADVVLLDNMSTEQMAEAVRYVRAHQGSRHIVLEASGNVTLERVPEIAATGVDLISSGALTHSAPAADLSLELSL